ncbi:hypothetical protein C8J55DRAFT_516503 [Lentinula edodes]|uniref:Uncharacterized protein n=1 Tax=Lentinula lateritia TaxID=40482 RepID=A0A9W9ABF0_9AGAR|nr:hypothetical protein C8J55DRAFT_516503 [Lentinula edodes]
MRSNNYRYINPRKALFLAFAAMVSVRQRLQELARQTKNTSKYICYIRSRWKELWSWQVCHCRPPVHYFSLPASGFAICCNRN